MFNPWLTLSLKAIQMGFEVQSVIALRMLRLATGGARMEAEATRMITEKAATAAEAQAVAAVAVMKGHPQHVVAGKTLRVFRLARHATCRNAAIWSRSGDLMDILDQSDRDYWMGPYRSRLG